MDANVRHILGLACALLIFVSALSMAVSYYQSAGELLAFSASDSKRQDRTIHEKLEISNSYTVKGADILSMVTMLHSSNVVIEIEGHQFLPETNKEDMPVHIIVVDKKYIPEYSRDASGHLLRIRYR